MTALTAIKLAQWVTGILCLACTAFGFGTAWFVVGMFAGVASLVLYGMWAHLRADELRRAARIREANRIPASVLFDLVAAEWSKRGAVTTEIVHERPQNWQHIEGGKRPVWPSEIGAPE